MEEDIRRGWLGSCRRLQEEGCWLPPNLYLLPGDELHDFTARNSGFMCWGGRSGLKGLTRERDNAVQWGRQSTGRNNARA